MKNSTKVNLLSFNTTAVFLHACRKMTLLKRDSAVGVFACVTFSSDCWFELQVE